MDAVELVPVVELEPWAFAARERPPPAGTGPEMPAAWTRYWLDSLADAGVTGLTPLRPASWLVTTRQLSEAHLGRILPAVVRRWGGPEVLSDPDGGPVLSGGLALCRDGDVLIPPTCCGDLGDLAEWRAAVEYRRPEWKMVWVGHPWVSVRYDGGRLVLSELHESDVPAARWAVMPDVLGRAVAAAAADLEDFARRLLPALHDMGVADASLAARKLAGLTD